MSADLTLHDDDATAAITAELVRLTLGQPGPWRPELNMGFAAAMARMTEQFTTFAAAVGDAMLPIAERMAAALSKALRDPLGEWGAVTWHRPEAAACVAAVAVSGQPWKWALIDHGKTAHWWLGASGAACGRDFKRDVRLAYGDDPKCPKCVAALNAT